MPIIQELKALNNTELGIMCRNYNITPDHVSTEDRTVLEHKLLMAIIAEMATENAHAQYERNGYNTSATSLASVRDLKDDSAKNADHEASAPCSSPVSQGPIGFARISAGSAPNRFSPRSLRTVSPFMLVPEVHGRHKRNHLVVCRTQPSFQSEDFEENSWSDSNSYSTCSSYTDFREIKQNSRALSCGGRDMDFRIDEFDDPSVGTDSRSYKIASPKTISSEFEQELQTNNYMVYDFPERSDTSIDDEFSYLKTESLIELMARTDLREYSEDAGFERATLERPYRSIWRVLYELLWCNSSGNLDIDKVQYTIFYCTVIGCLFLAHRMMP